MSNEYKGHVTVQILGVPVRIGYRVVWGAVPYVMDAYINNGDNGVQIIGYACPDAVRVRIYDAIVADVRERVVELHPYELPEVVVLPVEGGHPPYLDRVRAEVGS